MKVFEKERTPQNFFSTNYAEMSKFTVLQNNQRFLSSILRIDVEQKKHPRMKSTDQFFKSIPVHLILIILFSLAASSAVRTHNSSYDFTVRLAASLIFIAACQVIVIFLAIGKNVQTIVALYRTLQAIVDSEGK